MKRIVTAAFCVCLFALYGCGNVNVNEIPDSKMTDFEIEYSGVSVEESESDNQAVIYDTYDVSENQVVEVNPEPLLYFVNASDSRQKLDYMVYTPAEYDENTPIFTFLHGDGDTAMTFAEELDRYEFLRKLQSGEWQPQVIFVMPVARKQGHWAKEVSNVKAILEETVEDVGGSLDNMYISGASAGANGMTVLAGEVEFRGAVYMAGFLGSEFNAVSTDDWLKLWQGKTVYYYVDNLYAHGGYGYRSNVKYMENLEESFEDYNIDFYKVDLQWNHDIGLVDATFLPEEYLDLNGNKCFGGLEKMIEY